MSTSSITKRWALASVGGIFLGIVVQSAATTTFLPGLLPDDPVMSLFPMDLSLGLTIGALQALVLRRHLAHALLWVVATGVGVAAAEVVAGFILHDVAGLVFGFYRSPRPEALAALAIVGVSLGACVGSAQWLVLRQAGHLSLFWIPATIAGLTGAIGLADYLAVPEAFFMSFFGLTAGLVLGGMLYGFVTGQLLTRLIATKQ